MSLGKYVDDAAAAVGNAISKGKAIAANTNLDDIAKSGKKLFKDAVSSPAASSIKNTVKDASKHKLFDNRRSKLIAQTVAEKKFVSDIKDVGVKRTLQGGSQYMSSVGKTAAKTALRPTRIVDPNVGNLFTGHELKSGVDKTLALGAFGFGVGLGVVQSHKDGNQSPIEESIGNLPGLSYDAVSNASGGRNELGATGDLVFGLHSQRKG